MVINIQISYGPEFKQSSVDTGCSMASNTHRELLQKLIFLKCQQGFFLIKEKLDTCKEECIIEIRAELLNMQSNKLCCPDSGRMFLDGKRMGFGLHSLIIQCLVAQHRYSPELRVGSLPLHRGLSDNACCAYQSMGASHFHSKSTNRKCKFLWELMQYLYQYKDRG